VGQIKFIPINKPIMDERDKRAVDEVIESGMLTDASFEGGKKVREFEGKVAALLGVKHVVAVNSGTSALQTALMAYGIKAGDEVIVPALTFEATANVVVGCGAKPVFADVLPDYTIDPEDVRRKVTPKTRAIIPVHVYGYPADLDTIREIAEPKSIKVIEDAAESLGAEYRGTQTGNTDHAGCFSLYATKVITSGEGGAVSTNDDELADRMRMVRNHGMKEGYDTRVLGYNLRMPEMAAAMATVQMDKLPDFIVARRRNATRLTEAVGDLAGVEMTQTEPERRHIWYLYTLRIQKGRDRVHKRLRAKGIGSAVYWKTPVNRMPFYSEMGYGHLDLPGCYDAADHVLSLPVNPAVEPAEIDYIAKEFRAAVGGV